MSTRQRNLYQDQDGGQSRKFAVNPETMFWKKNCRVSFQLAKGREDKGVMFVTFTPNEGGDKITMALTVDELAGIVSIFRGDYVVRGQEEKLSYVHAGDGRPTKSLQINRNTNPRGAGVWFMNIRSDKGSPLSISLTHNESARLGLFLEQCLTYLFNLQPLPQLVFPQHYQQ